MYILEPAHVYVDKENLRWELLGWSMEEEKSSKDSSSEDYDYLYQISSIQ